MAIETLVLVLSHTAMDTTFCPGGAYTFQVSLDVGCVSRIVGEPRWLSFVGATTISDGGSETTYES
jgi:hypothetical protein